MVMCVCVDIAPGMYLCVLHVLICSLCYIVVPTIWGGPAPRNWYIYIYILYYVTRASQACAKSSRRGHETMVSLLHALFPLRCKECCSHDKARSSLRNGERGLELNEDQVEFK